MRYNTRKLRDIQRAISRDVKIKDVLEKGDIKRVAGFDVSIHENTLVCAAVVVSYPDMEVLERKYLVRPAPMPYVPTFLAFREGPLMLELYYELEYDPDLLIIDGHGIAHPYRCGIATYIGHELSKPSIGVAKNLVQGGSVYEGDKLVVAQEIRGFLVKTKEHAKPLYVSPGHLISRESAAELVKESVRLPHKLPEPLHLAHRYAEKMKKSLFKKSRKERQEATAATVEAHVFEE